MESSRKKEGRGSSRGRKEDKERGRKGEKKREKMIDLTRRKEWVKEKRGGDETGEIMS